MNIARPSADTRTAPVDSRFGLPADVRERLKNLLVATLVAVGLFAGQLLNPVDQISWMLQSRLVETQASGDIVFVSTPGNMADPDRPERRKQLANLLYELERQGADQIYIDIPIAQKSNSNDADAQLAQAIQKLQEKITLVNRLNDIGIKSEHYIYTLPEFVGNTKEVVSKKSSNWLGLVWYRDSYHKIDDQRYQSLASALAGRHPPSIDPFPIDYSVPLHDIPSETMDHILAANGKVSIRDRIVVVGEDNGASVLLQRIPGYSLVPYTYIDIFSAETIKSGRYKFISAIVVLTSFFLFFAASLTTFQQRLYRRLSYGVFVFALPCAFVLGAWFGFRLELSYCIAVLILYGVARWRAWWKTKISLEDQEIGLSKLRALELKISEDIHSRGYLIVARIHGYEHVVRSLPRNVRAPYVRKLVERLRASDAALEIYYEGHYLAWHSLNESEDVLVEHLEGLRAMFAAPIDVAGSSVDVGISFGIARLDGDPAARLAAAVAAAEESSEALHPIKIAESSSKFDELWDISLRARIDQAMAAGEIFCVYQPKIDTRNGAMTGVEALVRWQDPARGFIPPMHFIAQCEKAGRMEALTQYVFEHACAAGRLMHFRGRSVSMAVNISATLLADMRIVGIVRNVLQSSGFDARFLILEVTETSRIGNLATAEMVLNELRDLGARISMDDFGVGETNFETLFELPFDELKVDRLFIGNMTKSAKAKAIVTSLVNMGREARIGVVAEGAEDVETVKMLTAIGCTHVQGYVLARPMSLENLLEFNALTGEATRKA